MEIEPISVLGERNLNKQPARKCQPLRRLPKKTKPLVTKIRNSQSTKLIKKIAQRNPEQGKPDHLQCTALTILS